jgi:hypothetical protein
MLDAPNFEPCHIHVLAQSLLLPDRHSSQRPIARRVTPPMQSSRSTVVCL